MILDFDNLDSDIEIRDVWVVMWSVRVDNNLVFALSD